MDETRLEVYDMAKKTFIDILEKYKNKTEEMKDYFELEKITRDMIMEINEKSILSVVSFSDYLVIDFVKDIVKYDECYKNYPLDDDRMSWITREFHNSYYDYDGIERDVKNAMEYTREYYKK